MGKRKTSKAKDLFELAEDPKFIPGIYNYCDRWCERCPFTSRCLVYAQEVEDGNDPATQDTKQPSLKPILTGFWIQ